MMIIFYSKLKESFTESERNLINQYFNNNMLSRVLKSSSSLYQKRRYTFMNMMFKICKYLNIPFEALNEIDHNSYGKLIMSGYNIAISYTGSYVFCLMSECKIGFDVEKIDTNIEDNRMLIFNKLLNTDIKHYVDFFKEWTRIESLVKYYEDKGLKNFFFSPKDVLSKNMETIFMKIKGEYQIALSGTKLSFTKEVEFKKL